LADLLDHSNDGVKCEWMLGRSFSSKGVPWWFALEVVALEVASDVVHDKLYQGHDALKLGDYVMFLPRKG